MKIFVKTLKGSHFEIEVQPENTVADVKKSIETVQGQNVYPAAQQLLIHQGKVLKDDTTLEENKIAENSFVVIMLTKTKSSTGGGPSASAAPSSKVPTSTPLAIPSPAAAPQALVPEPAPEAAAPAPTPTPTPAAAAPAPTPAAAAPALAPAPAPAAAPSLPASEIDIYDQAASNLVAGSNFNQSVEQILDMGGGSWDRDTVVRALRAAFNNPERAVEYLYSGIPEQADVPPVAQTPASGQPPNPAAPQQPAQPVPIASSGPNANPLNLFPQGFPNVGTNAGEAGPLDFLRDSPQFQTLRTMVQANPQVLQPMLQELAKQNPQLVRLIQEHNADFLRLINEPGEGQDSGIFGLPEAMPQAIQVTLEERDAIERLESMGFDRATVLEVYFACNKNEELAANYLLDHMHEFED